MSKNDITKNLDYEVTSSKPMWVIVTLPDGQKWRVSVSMMLDAVRARATADGPNFDLDLRWQAKWEKVE